MMGIGGRLAALALAFGLASCQQPTGDKSDTSAITNRPQNRDKFIAIVKLEKPALLTTARREGATVKVDEALKAAILAEQEAFEAKLQALSPEVVVLHRYRMVLNALAVIAPKTLESELRALDGTSYVEAEQLFERLDVQISNAEAGGDLARANSVAFIEGLRVHEELGIKGEEMTVGIIDTGIDYTHAMFGGAGTAEAFEENDPNVVEEGTFPTAKVVGGIDLVGTEYNAASPEFGQHIPLPDADPIDEGGHGTHVAGTVAGIGDGAKSYSGVAPEAKLHAIKVFGRRGSTGDATIIAALEYAADPNGDLDPNDQLDVVNLSLGSSYGTPHLLYTQAMANLVAGGTIAVASGGNSGHTSYIVGAPGSSDAAISVAASIDDMRHNWQFAASAFTLADGSEIIAKAVEATFTKPIADGDVRDKLVYIGLASQPLDADTAAKVRGNVAFIDRGAVTFCEKADHAVAAGAIAFVIANNADGAPFRMGGDCKHEVPGIMVTKTVGDALKESLAQGDVLITFKTDEVVEEPELIDTLTDFSSRGPRSIDALIKPEVAAPGFNVISAKMGGGSEVVQMSGTSMAAPHVAGLAALVKQARPDLTPAQLKSLIVNSTVSISDIEGNEYPVAMQGAGRVRAYAAATAKVAVEPATLSLGQVLVEKRKAVRDSLRLTNVSDEALTLTTEIVTDAGLTLELPTGIELAAGEAKDVKITAVLEPVFTDDAAVELDGFVHLKAGDAVLARIPVLAVARKAARLKAQELRVKATSPADAAGAVAALTLKNAGETAGDALPFNLIARDERSETARANSHRHTHCDLEASGFRIVEKEVEGEKLQLLQIGVKLYNPVTTWHLCEISVQIDGNGDDVADQELLGTVYQNYHDIGGADLFASVLTDASQMRQIRRDFETNWPAIDEADYSAAIQDVQEYGAYGHSTVAVVSADLAKLNRTAGGDLKVKVAVLGGTGSPEDDDFLAKHATEWHTLHLGAEAQGYVDLPEKITLAAGETKTVELTAGTGRGKLLVLFPHNASNFSDVTRDDQSQLVNPKYGF